MRMRRRRVHHHPPKRENGPADTTPVRVWDDTRTLFRRNLSPNSDMLVLFTDFGSSGPYVGQMKAVLAREAPGTQVIDLLHEAPAFNARSSAYLLAALVGAIPAGAVFCCIVDPGVGTARRALALQADERWFVGPDNGLLEIVARRARAARWLEIAWRPDALSATFHGRDLFAPVAARLARGDASGLRPCDPPDHRLPHDLAEVVYVDPYGNAATGLRAGGLAPDCVLQANGRCFLPVRTFGEAPAGAPIWYPNSSGLAELAINQGSAAGSCGLAVGAAVTVAAECD
jgi:S-adenosyl-L-methionine hydrolase (adenosine-forming)